MSDTDFGHLGKVVQQDITTGFPAIIIEHPRCQAKVSLYGGHVLSWQPNQQAEVFWLSKTSLYQEGKAIRGGIPICWPWFGPLEGTNQHGFARQSMWQLANVDVTELGVTLDITWQGLNMDELWPYHAKVTQSLFFGETFKQTFHIENLSDEAFSYTGALHSYFAVSSPDNVTVPHLNGVSFYDKLTDKTVDNLTRDNCQGPIDTVYQTAAPQQLIDTGYKRVISVHTENTHQWVLWNPGVETAAKMADVHPQGEQEYVCLEAANTDWQSVPAKQSVEFSQTISVAAL